MDWLAANMIGIIGVLLSLIGVGLSVAAFRKSHNAEQAVRGAQQRESLYRVILAIEQSIHFAREIQNSSAKSWAAYRRDALRETLAEFCDHTALNRTERDEIRKAIAELRRRMDNTEESRE